MIEKRFTQGPAKKNKRELWRGWRREMGGGEGQRHARLRGE